MLTFNITASIDKEYIDFPFVKDNKIIKSSVRPFLTLRSAGNMRFRWNEHNERRISLFSKISGLKKSFVPLELIHSQIVVDVKSKEDTKNMQADGMITKNPDLLPVVTVADCVPIYLYDDVTGVFGIVHSGWKGTGIIGKAIKLAEKNYGSKPEDFMVIIGPHIRDCCYIVDQERADYFSKNFTPECITPLEENGTCFCGGRGLAIEWNNGNGKLFRLSLEKANIEVIKKAGVKEENICLVNECTCCNEMLGSNRRQTAINVKENNIDVSLLSVEEKSKLFTVMAAFVGNL